MKKLFIFLSLQTILLHFYAQANDTVEYPKIGKPCPDFVLSNIKYYHKSNATLREFRGKWLVLDFWSEFCGGCIASFPKMNAIQKEFGSKLQVILIGLPYKKQEVIESLYEKARKSRGLQLPVVYDNGFKKRFGADGLPLLIVVDPDGIVRAITYTLSVNDITDFINGKNPELPRNYLANENPVSNYNRQLPLLINGNGGTEMDFLCRSILTKWNRGMPTDTRIEEGIYELLGVDLKTLYKFAYIGKSSWFYGDTLLYSKFYPEPMLEIKDSSLFAANYNTGKNVFCYSIIRPTDTVKNFGVSGNKNNFSRRPQKWLQNDLINYFGYFGHIEVRKMPCYKLVASSEAKLHLKTKGGEPLFEPILVRAGIKAKNVPIHSLIGPISSSIGAPKDYPIFDETGIEENIDIQIDDGLYFEDFVKSMKRYGLDLVLDKKEMKVLVIKDYLE